MNPRYLAYCKAQGEPDPDKMMERDGELYPGGVMTGYIVWIGSMWMEWKDENKKFYSGDLRTPSDSDHDLFDAWLKKKVEIQNV